MYLQTEKIHVKWNRFKMCSFFVFQMDKLDHLNSFNQEMFTFFLSLFRSPLKGVRLDYEVQRLGDSSSENIQS